jgi:hypothetical protein
MPEHVEPDCDRVAWRRLSDYLWVGTSDDGPVGTIEHGRRFYAIDTSGSVVARCSDLATAQAALARSAEVLPAAGERGGSSAGRHAGSTPRRLARHAL